MDALIMAAIFHSDRGSQYASRDFLSLRSEHGMFCNISHKGDCWDNDRLKVSLADLGRNWYFIRNRQPTLFDKVFLNTLSNAMTPVVFSRL